MRMVFILLSFAVFFVAMKFAFFRVPIHFDYLVAAFLFYFCFDAAFLSAYQSHRRQQIQIKDNTYVDAEWRFPRTFTGSTADPVRSKTNDSASLARLSAFGIVSGAMVGTMTGAMGTMVATQQTQPSGRIVIVLMAAGLTAAGVALLQVLGFARRQNLPRYPQLQRSPGFFGVPIIMGLCTLLSFNYPQYVAHTVGNAFNRASPSEILVFNLVIVLAYALFIIGIKAWKSKSVCAPGMSGWTHPCAWNQTI
jgi:hypothetical protein